MSEFHSFLITCWRVKCKFYVKISDFPIYSHYKYLSKVGYYMCICSTVITLENALLSQIFSYISDSHIFRNTCKKWEKLLSPNVLVLCTSLIFIMACNITAGLKIIQVNTFCHNLLVNRNFLSHILLIFSQCKKMIKKQCACL